MISRRGFLAALAGLVAAPALLRSDAVLPGATGEQLVTDGWGTGQLRKGDVFTIAGVYMVNPITKQPLENLQRFVVTADTRADQCLVPVEAIWPRMVRAGMYQNVSGADPVVPALHAIPMKLIRPLGYGGYPVGAFQKVAFH